MEAAPADVACSMSVCSSDHCVPVDELRVCSLLFSRLWHSVTLLKQYKRGFMASWYSNLACRVVALLLGRRDARAARLLLSLRCLLVSWEEQLDAAEGLVVTPLQTGTFFGGDGRLQLCR